MPITLDVWPGGWQNQGLQDLVTQINQAITNTTSGTETLDGEIGCKFDNRPFELGYTPPDIAIIPYSGTITQCAVIADQIGSCTISILKTTLATFPAYTSIVASAPPTLAGVEISLDTTLAGWDTAVLPGDVLLFLLTSSSTIQQVTVALSVTKTGTTGTGSSSSGGGFVSAGVTSVSKSGSPHLIGDVTLSEGANITLTQVGNNIAIASSGGGSNAWNPVLTAQPTGTHLAANTLLIMDSATD